MIPDVTPNGVFYLPPTGWLTSFYNPPFKLKKEDLFLKLRRLFGMIIFSNYFRFPREDEEK
ncbi:hypothetical protein DN431_08405 [Lactobacillus reuteri]|nr:hypothetical protein [Limosilactobacillus reuteri]MQB68147.1 hypothetical protein [Limosilactobacillus reuteri]MQB83238.1 hypothetical protein [Limosilactobacillus reuteri]